MACNSERPCQYQHKNERQFQSYVGVSFNPFGNKALPPSIDLPMPIQLQRRHSLSYDSQLLFSSSAFSGLGCGKVLRHLEPRRWACNHQDLWPRDSESTVIRGFDIYKSDYTRSCYANMRDGLCGLQRGRVEPSREWGQW